MGRLIEKLLRLSMMLSILAMVIIFASAYTDIPQLESIRQKSQNFFNTIFSNKVYSMNDTAITSDGLSISVTDVDVKQVNRIMAPEGAQYLFVKISVTNNGDSKTPYDTVHIQKQTYINGINVASTKDIITLQYNNQKIFPEDSAHYGLENDWGWEGFGNKYPGVTKEGWVCFEVQENLDLNRTAITVHGLKWNLGS